MITSPALHRVVSRQDERLALAAARGERRGGAAIAAHELKRADGLGRQVVRAVVAGHVARAQLQIACGSEVARPLEINQIILI